MKNIADKVVTLAVLSAFSFAVYFGLGFSGVFGSRGVKTQYEFKYQGNPAAIKFEDRRFWFDQYFIETNGMKITEGELKSDSGETIKVYSSRGEGSKSSYKITKD